MKTISLPQGTIEIALMNRARVMMVFTLPDEEQARSAYEQIDACLKEGSLVLRLETPGGQHETVGVSKEG